MPKRTTKFNPHWLTQKDDFGAEIGSWCTKADCDTEAHCIICNKNFDVSNSGMVQVKQHAKGKKHQSVTSNRDKSQTRLTFNTDADGQKNVQLESSGTSWNMSHQQRVSKAEAIWTLKVAQANYSYSSCDDLTETFTAMFPADPVAKDFTLGSTKVSYELSHGLGPYFHDLLVEDLNRSKVPYSLLVDETTNDAMDKQLDMIVRYWSLKSNQVEARFFKCCMIGHATAEIMKERILTSLENDNVAISRMVMLGSDGPAVNKLLFKKIDSACKETGSPGLVDIGTCNLHVVHNSFGSALSAVDTWKSDEFLEEVFKWFHKYPARKEDFVAVQRMLEYREHVFLRFVSNRWLSLVPVIERLTEQWVCLKEYFVTYLPVHNPQACKTEKYKTIRSHLDHSETLVRLHFLKSVGTVYNKFLTLLQTEGPLVHLLHDELSELLWHLMKKILDEAVLEGVRGKQLAEIDLNNAELYLKPEKLDVGKTAASLAQKLKTLDRKAFYADAKMFLVTAIKYLRERVPLGNPLLKNLQCLHPLARNHAGSLRAIQQVCALMPHAKVDVDCVATEWMLYQTEEKIEKEWSIMEEGLNADGDTFIKWHRIDHYWSRVLLITRSQGQAKYPQLAKLVRASLVLSHGQADVERGFSKNRHVVTIYRGNLKQESVNAVRTVQDAIASYGGKAAQVPITRQMITSFQGAASKYKADLASKKRKRAEEEQQRKEQEEQNLVKLKQQKEKELKLKQEQHEEEIRKASILLKEANQRLAKAIKKKDFMEATAAQALLESADQTLDRSTKELKKVQQSLKKLSKANAFDSQACKKAKHK